jgi:endonuclease/exonuclease/phosphatase family metal-dependent hydrolase
MFNHIRLLIGNFFILVHNLSIKLLDYSFPYEDIILDTPISEDITNATNTEDTEITEAIEDTEIIGVRRLTRKSKNREIPEETDEITAEIEEKTVEKELNKTIFSYNINKGLDMKRKNNINRIIDTILPYNYGIICLQEVKNYDHYNYLKRKLNYEYGYYNKHKCILSNYKIIKENTIYYSDLELYNKNCFLHCSIQLNDEIINVFNIHLTNDITFFKQSNEKQEITNYIEFNNLSNVIIIGDTNCIDKFDKNDNLYIYKKHRMGATFPSCFPILSLDKIYTKDVKILNTKVHEYKLSDHRAISFSFLL